ncbi:gliding motility-associated C-terminal domain-containing protein [Flavilitoribacter nigricans]|uniref:Gliding motility-associated C-terminal domain-containing protein n=1 Tax=Flavilitoribacter nigricans (strain ATCC 23147 / DSM 23189 / NBRC 102662 / NCIMB 1420 / SS-2) TaxID=1122177 RepID=A0A2D0N944_FLAN2|nr:gliding motility-associated C-terminal domain-containing protein [Flavilitoribacter nigricans]PHN05041.1 hypothetical protein CRP01_18630 [Flavilitoribacter nigricans DSM 23189 = NBRC 102662]
MLKKPRAGKFYPLMLLLLTGTLSLSAQDFLLNAGDFNSCTLIAPLSWEAYDGWSDGVLQYEVWASQKSPASDWPGPAELIATLDGNITNYDFYADDGRQHCLEILAISPDQQDTVRSNQICMDVPILLVQDIVVLDSASVNQDFSTPPGSVALSWRTDLPNSPLQDGELFRSTDGIDFELVKGFNFRTGFFLDEQANAHLGPRTYRIHAYDRCRNEEVSNTLTTIFLRGETGENGLNSLRWTPYQNEFLFDNQFYFVVTEPVDGPLNLQDPVANYGGDVYDHSEIIDLEDPAQRTLCYSIVSAPRLYRKGKLYERTTSFSNRVCLTHTTSLFIPNAFAPNGVNTEFRPYGHFGDVGAYSMQIFSRYGSLVYESRSLDNGWDGTSNGRSLPMGVYVYRIRMQQQSGEWVEKRGDILLVR